MPFLTFSLAHPLPPGCAPERVLQALHRYEPLITPNPYLVSWRRRPVDLAEIVDDAFFRDDGQALAAFEIVDRIVLVPGLAFASKHVVIPCVMQRFAGGLRCRSLAAGGVRVWSTWRVADVRGGANKTGRHGKLKPRSRHHRDDDQQAMVPAALSPGLATPPATPPETPPAIPPAIPPKDTTTPAYALVEDARVECSALVKPFVSRSFQAAHLAILRTVVDEIMRGDAGGGGGGGGGGSAGTPEHASYVSR